MGSRAGAGVDLDLGSNIGVVGGVGNDRYFSDSSLNDMGGTADNMATTLEDRDRDIGDAVIVSALLGG